MTVFRKLCFFRTETYSQIKWSMRPLGPTIEDIFPNMSWFRQSQVSDCMYFLMTIFYYILDSAKAAFAIRNAELDEINFNFVSNSLVKTLYSSGLLLVALFVELSSRLCQSSMWQHKATVSKAMCFCKGQGHLAAGNRSHWLYCHCACVAGGKPLHRYGLFWIPRPWAQTTTTTACTIPPPSPPSWRRATSRPAPAEHLAHATEHRREDN